MANDTKKPHRRMGMAAIWMARDSGVSPLALADHDDTQAKEFPRWITAWFLKQANQMSPNELSQCLGLPRGEVSQMLSHLERIRSTQPLVDEWMTGLVHGQVITDTTKDGEAA